MQYQSLTTPFAHQKRIHQRSRDLEAFALLMEMGTGKSKLFVDGAGHLHCNREIGDVIIGCPNGLQRNWRSQFEIHCGIPTQIAIYETSMKADERRNLERLLASPKDREERLRVLLFNIEALRGGFMDVIEEYLDGRETYFGIDESQRIKSKKAVQTKAALRLANFTKYRRIASGTSTPQGPPDLFTQFAFLDPKILGFKNFTAYNAYYCELVAKDDPLMLGLAKKMGPRANFVQIQAHDPITGRPLYKNLDDLSKRIAPYTARALKSECLDLPPKLYERVTIRLTTAQQRIYNEVRKSVLAEFVHDGRLYQLDSKLAISRLLRLAQISGNHFPDDVRKPVRIETKNNPRMEALLQILEDAPHAQGIIWCRHLAEIDEVEAYLGRKCRRLDGSVSPELRAERIAMFQAGTLQYLVAQEAIGIGFDAYAASIVVYYTNDYSLEHRLQSEDRAHRAGLTHRVSYWDIEAVDPIDTKIIDSLRNKREISEVIAGDPITKWI